MSVQKTVRLIKEFYRLKTGLRSPFLDLFILMIITENEGISKTDINEILYNDRSKIKNSVNNALERLLKAELIYLTEHPNSSRKNGEPTKKFYISDKWTIILETIFND